MCKYELLVKDIVQCSKGLCHSDCASNLHYILFVANVSCYIVKLTVTISWLYCDALNIVSVVEVCVTVNCCDLVHIQIPWTEYVCLIYHSTTVATTSWSTFEGTLQLL